MNRAIALVAISALMSLARPGPGQVYTRTWDQKLVLTNIPKPNLASLKKFRTRNKEEYKKLAREAALKYGIRFEVLDAVIVAESGYLPTAVSPKGAQGLMQLMPGTADNLGVLNSFDPGQNIDAGARYLKAMLDRFSSLELALAAYNAGPAAVERYGGIPPYQETRQYVSSIMKKLGQPGFSFDPQPVRSPKPKRPAKKRPLKVKAGQDGNIYIGN